MIRFVVLGSRSRRLQCEGFTREDGTGKTDSSKEHLNGLGKSCLN